MPIWMQVTGFVLSAIGSSVAMIYIVRVARLWISEWQRRRGNKQARRDFYYLFREAGYRIIEPGRRYLSVRRERIKALRDGLEGIHLLYSWTGQGTVQESHSPTKYTKEELDAIPGKPFVRRFLRFDHPLAKGEEAEYEFSLDCNVKESAPLSFLLVRFEHRVDELIMRVVFPPDSHPEQVTHCQRFSSGEASSGVENLPIDTLTGEVTKHVRHPLPYKDYLIEWK